MALPAAATALGSAATALGATSAASGFTAAAGLFDALSQFDRLTQAPQQGQPNAQAVAGAQAVASEIRKNAMELLKQSTMVQPETYVGPRAVDPNGVPTVSLKDVEKQLKENFSSPLLPFATQRAQAQQNAEARDDLEIKNFAELLEHSFDKDTVVRFVHHVCANTGVNIRQVSNLPPDKLEALHRLVQKDGYDQVPVLAATEEPVLRSEKRLRQMYADVTPSFSDFTVEKLLEKPKPLVLEKSSAWDFICAFFKELRPHMSDAKIELDQMMRYEMNENQLLAHNTAWMAWASMTAYKFRRVRAATGRVNMSSRDWARLDQNDRAVMENIKKILKKAGLT